MTNSPRAVWIVLVLIVLLGAGFLIFVYNGRQAVAPSSGNATTTPVESNQVQAQNGTAQIGFTQSASFQGVSVTPLEILEDSRCPVDVTCIQAGRVRLSASVTKGTTATTQEFTIGEPVTVSGMQITLTAVTPAKVSKQTITKDTYRFTFKFEEANLTYANASNDLIQITLPLPGNVVGKTFKVQGQARGTWFFEASFPVQVLDKNGNVLASTPAQAKGDWMTSDFVPFEANLTVPDSYIGPARIVLKKDNPSGLPEKEASVSFPITIEY